MSITNVQQSPTSTRSRATEQPTTDTGFYLRNKDSFHLYINILKGNLTYKILFDSQLILYKCGSSHRNYWSSECMITSSSRELQLNALITLDIKFADCSSESTEFNRHVSHCPLIQTVINVQVVSSANISSRSRSKLCVLECTKHVLIILGLSNRL